MHVKTHDASPRFASRLGLSAGNFYLGSRQIRKRPERLPIYAGTGEYFVTM